MGQADDPVQHDRSHAYLDVVEERAYDIIDEQALNVENIEATNDGGNSSINSSGSSSSPAAIDNRSNSYLSVTDKIEIHKYKSLRSKQDQEITNAETEKLDEANINTVGYREKAESLDLSSNETNSIDSCGYLKVSGEKKYITMS